MPRSPEELLNILAFFNRQQLDQLCLVAKCLNKLIQKHFSSTPYRMLSQFTSSPNIFTIDFPYKSALLACKSFTSFQKVFPFISPAGRIRAKCSCVYFNSNQQIQPFVQKFNQSAHLWLDNHLCIVFDGFNQQTDRQARNALKWLLEQGIYCSHLTVAMIYDCNTPFYLTHFSTYLTKFDKFTLKIMGERVVQKDLIDYLHSFSNESAENCQMLSIFFYLTKQVDEEPIPFGEWQGFQLGEFLSELKQNFLSATSAVTYQFTALLACDVDLELFELENIHTNEQLSITEVQKNDRLMPVGYSVQRRRKKT